MVVLIGEDEIKFTAHKDVLCKTSRYFEAACSPQWLNEGSPPLKLPADHLPAFSIYLHWAYSGHLVHGLDESEPSSASHTFARLAEIYVLADKLISPALMNCAIDQIRSFATSNKENPGVLWVDYVFENTTEHSKLRDWIVDEYHYRAAEIDFGKDATELHPELINRVIHQMAATRTLNDSFLRLRFLQQQLSCYYHEYDQKGASCRVSELSQIYQTKARCEAESRRTSERIKSFIS